MTMVKAGLLAALSITLHKADGTAEDRNPTLTNVVATVTPVNGSFGSLAPAPDDSGQGGKIQFSSNAGDEGTLNITGHVKFDDGEEYDVALKDDTGVIGPLSIGVSTDDEAGDFLTVTLGKV